MVKFVLIAILFPVGIDHLRWDNRHHIIPLSPFGSSFRRFIQDMRTCFAFPPDFMEGARTALFVGVYASVAFLVIVFVVVQINPYRNQEDNHDDATKDAQIIIMLITFSPVDLKVASMVDP